MSLRNTNSVSLDYTHKPVFQTDLRHRDGTPEAGVKAPAGTLLIDSVNGKLYIKQSDENVATGWKQAAVS